MSAASDVSMAVDDLLRERSAGTSAARRRGYRVPPRSILDTEGPPVRVRDLATWSGWSKDKLMDESRRGRLAVIWQRCGTKRWAFVERAEARRYLSTLAVIE